MYNIHIVHTRKHTPHTYTNALAEDTPLGFRGGGFQSNLFVSNISRLLKTELHLFFGGGVWTYMYDPLCLPMLLGKNVQPERNFEDFGFISFHWFLEYFVCVFRLL